MKTLACENCKAWKKSMFSDLSPSMIDKINRSKKSQMYKKGEVLTAQGQPVEEISCLSSGSAKIVKGQSGSGEESIVRIVTPGEMVGYRCIFSEKVYRASSVALEDTVACGMSKNVLFELIAEDAQFARRMFEHLGREIAAAENRHHSFCLKNTRERVAEALYLLAQKCGVETAEGVLLPAQLSRTDWALWVGIAKENLIRCFSDFKKESLIREDNDFLVICDMRLLEKVALISS